jgi:hypothetical protein
LKNGIYPVFTLARPPIAIAASCSQIEGTFIGNPAVSSGTFLGQMQDGQYFTVPDGYVLDSAERLVIAYGPDSLQSEMVSWLGWSVVSMTEAEVELGFSVSQFEIGDIVLQYKDGLLIQSRLDELVDSGEYVEMYNVESVKDNHTFFANGVLVHNKSGH